MKSLKQTLTPRTGFDDNTESVESLGSLMRGSLQPNWLEVNYPTKNLQTVVETVFSRLDGSTGTVGFHLAQSMGGGKTHTLLCLGLLCKNPQLLSGYFPAVQVFDKRAAKVVCVDGRLNHPNGIWGTIAEQLGKKDQFSAFYSPLKAPDPDQWRALLNGERVLILIDELPYYLDGALATTVGNSDLCTVSQHALTNLFLACADSQETRQVAIVMTDLNAEAYPDGSQTIQNVTTQVLLTLGSEGEKVLETLQPVELETNDLYHILRRRLFQNDPDPAHVEEVANAYREALRKAASNNYCTGDPTTLANDIKETYPFSPAIKHLAARFRENSGFQQTRGMLRLFSRVVKHLYDSEEAENSHLIGPEHLDLSNRAIRDQVKKIHTGIQNAISKDFHQDGGTANLQQVPEVGDSSKKDLIDAARIVLFASLSHKEAELGLTPPQLGTWYASPSRDISRFPAIWQKLEDTCDYLHRTDPDNKLLFRQNENILVWVRRRAAEISEATVQKRLGEKLVELFKPESGSVYQRVEAFPNIADLVLDKDRTTLVILTPQRVGSLPQDAQDFWKGQRYKNRLIYLTGLKGGFADTTEHTRKMIAAKEGLERKDIGATERRMLEEQLERAMSAFRSSMINCFDTVFLPIDDNGFDRVSFQMSYTDDSYKGAREVTTVASSTGKFLPWDESNVVSSKEYAEATLFDNRVMRWSDVKENAATRPAWVMTTTTWLDELKLACVSSDWWRDVGADQVEHGPFERKTSLSLIPMGQREGKAKISLRPTPQDAVVRWCTGHVFDSSKAQTVQDLTSFETTELKCVFRCEDAAGQWTTGDDVTWSGKPELKRGSNQRPLEFQSTHQAEIYYTTDGSKPEPGKSPKYIGPVSAPEGSSIIQAVAVSEGITSEVMSVRVSIEGQPRRQGKVRYRQTNLNIKGAAQISAAMNHLAAAGALIESATTRLVLQNGGAMEIQLQEASFTPVAFKSQVDAVVTALPPPGEKGDERLLELFQILFPSFEAFEAWKTAQEVRGFRETDLVYVD
jgi:hypothetical protein